MHLITLLCFRVRSRGRGSSLVVFQQLYHKVLLLAMILLCVGGVYGDVNIPNSLPTELKGKLESAVNGTSRDENLEFCSLWSQNEESESEWLEIWEACPLEGGGENWVFSVSVISILILVSGATVWCMIVTLNPTRPVHVIQDAPNGPDVNTSKPQVDTPEDDPRTTDATPSVITSHIAGDNLEEPLHVINFPTPLQDDDGVVAVVETNYPRRHMFPVCYPHIATPLLLFYLTPYLQPWQTSQSRVLFLSQILCLQNVM